MVVKDTVCCGSKCTGARWKRMRKVPPRLGACATAPAGNDERTAGAGGARRHGHAAELEQISTGERRGVRDVHVRVSSCAQNVTGSDLSPRSVEDSRHSGTSETRASLGIRRNSVPRAS